MERVPIFDLKSEVLLLHDELMNGIESVLQSGKFIMGDNVKQFENEFASYLGVKHAVAVNSGTDALVIALKAAGIGDGDEVITTPFTFFATAEAINQVGAKPVFVDVLEDTYNIDVDKLEEVITPKSKAIIPVHLFGHAAEMDSVQSIAKKYGLKVIEDVAQATGAEYKGQKLGTVGDVGCFSFFPTKNLGAYGDGGLIATDDDQIAEMSKMLRAHGSKKKYHNEIFGYNSRLDEIQAAILRVKLPLLDEWNEKRAAVAKIYRALLQDISEIVLPTEKPGYKHVFHQYTIRVMNGKRDQIHSFLDGQGIGTMIYYPIPVHRLPVYQNEALSLPVAERLAGEVISLPIWPYITEAQIRNVAENLIKAVNKSF